MVAATGQNWQDIAAYFAPDGRLRDIYVLDTSMADWEAVWSMLSGSRDCLTCSADGVLRELPSTASEIFELGAEHSMLVTYAEGGIVINCHFFAPSEIEFDIDPREIGGPDAAGVLARFMAAVGEATSKPVLLTQENDQSTVIACFDPSTGAVEWRRAERHE